MNQKHIHFEKKPIPWLKDFEGSAYEIAVPGREGRGEAQLIFRPAVEYLKDTSNYAIFAALGLTDQDTVAHLNEFYPNGKGLKEKDAPEMRQGVGSATLEFLMSEAKKQNAKIMLVFSGKQSMQSFLQKKGFTSFGAKNLLHVKTLSMNQLNERGEIQNMTSLDKVNPAFLPLCDAVSAALQTELGETLHSVYAYGSIPEGRAIPGKSDADFVVVLKEPVDGVEEKMERISESLHIIFADVVIKIDLPTVTLEEATAEKNFFGWGVHLKTLGLPIYGEDLRAIFPEFRPCVEILREYDYKVPRSFDTAITLLKSDASEAEKQKEIRAIAGNILRAFFRLIAPEIQFWSTVLVDQTEKIVEYFPEHATEFRYLLAARKEGKPAAEFAQFLEKFQEEILPKLEAAL